MSPTVAFHSSHQFLLCNCHYTVRLQTSLKRKVLSLKHLLRFSCFLVSVLLGGLQGGEVLALCRSEVRALRLRCQTGEFQMKTHLLYTKDHKSVVVFLICDHTSCDWSCGSPPILPAVPSRLLFISLLFTPCSCAAPEGAVTHLFACSNKPTPTQALCVYLHVCDVLVFIGIYALLLSEEHFAALLFLKIGIDLNWKD